MVIVHIQVHHNVPSVNIPTALRAISLISANEGWSGKPITSQLR